MRESRLNNSAGDTVSGGNFDEMVAGVMVPSVIRERLCHVVVGVVHLHVYMHGGARARRGAVGGVVPAERPLQDCERHF